MDYRKIDLGCPGAGRVSFRNACVSVTTLYRMPNFLFADDPDGAVHRVGFGRHHPSNNGGNCGPPLRIPQEWAAANSPPSGRQPHQSQLDVHQSGRAPATLIMQ